MNHNFSTFLTNMYTYYNKTVKDFDLEVWGALGGEVGHEKIMQACRRHFKDPERGQFMPKISDISRVLGGTGKELGLIAWSKFMRAVRSIGTYNSVVFDDPIIHLCCQDLGGYIKFGTFTDDEIGYKQNEFVNLYKHYFTTIGERTWPKKLIGKFEIENPNYTYPTQFVGDIERCRVVYDRGVENAFAQTPMILENGHFKQASGYLPKPVDKSIKQLDNKEF